MLDPLSYIPSLMFTTDVSYFKFLNRVHDLELNLRAQEPWDVPHPWLNLFVPASSITTFDSLVFKQLVPVEFGGPILVYPVNRNKYKLFFLHDELILLAAAAYAWSRMHRHSRLLAIVVTLFAEKMDLCVMGSNENTTRIRWLNILPADGTAVQLLWYQMKRCSIWWHF